MENHSWRGRARVVAFLCLVIRALGLLVTAIPALVIPELLVVLSVIEEDDERIETFHERTGKTTHEIRERLIGILGYCATHFVVVTVDFWTASMLFISTERWNNVHESLQMAKIWRDFTFLPVGTIAAILFNMDSEFSKMGLIIHIVFLFVVQKFIWELEEIMTLAQRNEAGAPSKIACLMMIIRCVAVMVYRTYFKQPLLGKPLFVEEKQT